MGLIFYIFRAIFIFLALTANALAMTSPDLLCQQLINQQEESTQTLLQRDGTILQHAKRNRWITPLMIQEIKDGIYAEQKHLNTFLNERKSYQKQKKWNDCDSHFFDILQDSIDLQIKLKNDHILTLLYIEKNEREILNKHICSNQNECNQILLNYFIQKTTEDTLLIKKELQHNGKKMEKIHKPSIIQTPNFRVSHF